jgi:hypothetical protein
MLLNKFTIQKASQLVLVQVAVKRIHLVEDI